MAQGFIELLREKFPDAVVSSLSHKGDEVVTVKREKLVEVMTFLRNDPATDLKLLRQIAGVDLLTYKSEMTGGGSIASIEATPYAVQKKPQVEPRYYVSYNLYSNAQKKSPRVRVELPSLNAKGPTIPVLDRAH